MTSRIFSIYSSQCNHHEVIIVPFCQLIQRLKRWHNHYHYSRKERGVRTVSGALRGWGLGMTRPSLSVGPRKIRIATKVETQPRSTKCSLFPPHCHFAESPESPSYRCYLTFQQNSTAKGNVPPALPTQPSHQSKS
jgi:hypothetical protein